MKYCKKCHVLHSTDVCPKCGIIVPTEAKAEPAEADQATVRKGWLFLIIGIPAMIGLFYLVIKLLYY